MEKLITLKNPTIFFGQATTAYGILGPRPGMEPEAPALEGGFLTTGPAGKCYIFILLWANADNTACSGSQS